MLIISLDLPKKYSKRKDHIGPLRNGNDELTKDIPEICIYCWNNIILIRSMR